MTTKDVENDAENQNSSDEPEGDSASEGGTEAQDYVLALNKFTQLVSEMEWPDHFAIDNDTDLCIRMLEHTGSVCASNENRKGWPPTSRSF